MYILAQSLTLYLCRLSVKAPLSKAVPLGSTEKLKILLVATEGGKPKRPHQAFLLVADQDTGLETSFPFSLKDTGKGLVELVRLSTFFGLAEAD
jgi:oligosaccharyltransferase complex subunit delta (ribophorin II)